jgi:hypothetical protein
MKKITFALLLALSASYAKSQIVISGYIANPNGSDKNQEYVQLLATEDIDFAQKNFALVVCKNGTTVMPNAGEPASQGWATGGDRTYKFNLIAGVVKKGEYFYVGGKKNINGSKSANISAAKWIVSKNYSDEDGDGFGNATGGLFPNSGRAVGIAVFATNNVLATTVPIDVIFFQGTGGGNLWQDNQGYLICDNDLYNTKLSPYFRGSGKNKGAFNNADESDTTSYFTKLGGLYELASKKWLTARTNNRITLKDDSKLSDIEEGATQVR